MCESPWPPGRHTQRDLLCAKENGNDGSESRGALAGRWGGALFLTARSHALDGMSPPPRLLILYGSETGTAQVRVCEGK